MDTKGKIKARLQKRLVTADSSTLYTDDILDDLVDDAYVWATQFYPWKELRLALLTNSKATQYWYDYPEQYVTDSITYLEIDHGGATGVKEYEKKDFEHFIRWKRNHPNDQDVRIFADHERKWFVHPVPQVDGSLNVTVHGQQHADPLTTDASETIFTRGNKDGNEAVLKKAISLATLRIDQKFSKVEEQDAIGLLTRIFKRQKDNQQLNQSLDHPKFQVPDMFRQYGTYQPVGDFSYSNMR